MTVLTPTLVNSFNYISRYTGIPVDNIVLFSEEEKTTEIIPFAEISVSVQSYYDVITFNDLNSYLKDGYRYLLSVYDVAGALLWQDVVFCTSQPISTFSVNTGQYTFNTTNNQFIIYGQ